MTRASNEGRGARGVSALVGYGTAFAGAHTCTEGPGCKLLGLIWVEVCSRGPAGSIATAYLTRADAKKLWRAIGDAIGDVPGVR